jgi:hypothetical protein
MNYSLKNYEIKQMTMDFICQSIDEDLFSHHASILFDLNISQDQVDIHLHNFDLENNQYKNHLDVYPMSLFERKKIIRKKNLYQQLIPQ